MTADEAGGGDGEQRPGAGRPAGSPQGGGGRRLARAGAVALGLTLLALLGALGRAWQLRREAERAFLAADWAAADDRLARRLWYRPSDETALAMRVEVAERRQDPELAIGLLDAWPARSPRAGEARLRRGQLLKERFRIAAAEADFREAARLRPDDPEPRRQLVGILGIERREAEQVTMLWALYRAGARVEALRLLAQSGPSIPPGTIARTSDEGEVLERCLAADPNAPHLRAPLARFYRMRGQVEEVERLVGGPAGPTGADPAERLEWLAARLDAGEAAAVERWFREHAKEAARHPGFARLRGDALALAGRHDEAVRAYAEAAAADPRDAEIPYRRAASLRALGRKDEAAGALAAHRRLVDYAERAAAVDHTAPAVPALLDAARAAAALGSERRKEARAWYQEVTRLDPRNPDARAGLAALDDRSATTGGGGS